MSAYISFWDTEGCVPLVKRTKIEKITLSLAPVLCPHEKIKAVCMCMLSAEISNVMTLNSWYNSIQGEAYTRILGNFSSMKDNELFEFIKTRAIAMESTNSNIASVINTPRFKMVAMKVKRGGAVAKNRRGQLEFPKITEVKKSLPPW